MSLIALPIGCASTPDSQDAASNNSPSTDEQIFVGDSIEMSYDPNVIMKRAESFFDKESYAEAIVEYKHFLDLHRNHMLAPYAQYKIGMSHYQQFRTVDRDPEPLNNAIIGFEKLLKEFPGSRYETEATETIRTCKEQLVQRHLMVAEFYFKRESYLAAAHRYEKIIKDFPELETTSEAMFYLAKTYRDLGIEEWAQDWLVALTNRYPDSPYYSSAESLLASIREDNPTLVAALPQMPNLLKSPNPVIENHTLSPHHEKTRFANAGILPNTQTINSQNEQLSNQGATPSICPIGTWCDSTSSNSANYPAHSTADPTDNKACQTGEWC